MKIFVFGGPGSGKGTQAELLVEQFPQMTHFSSGDAFRKAMKDYPDSPLAKAMHLSQTEGILVPDDITCPFINEQLLALRSFVLDGYPRTIPQAQNLEQHDIHPDFILYYECSSELLVKRLSSRWMCKEGHIYNSLRQEDIVTSGACPEDGSPLFQREDDNPQTAQGRVEEYVKKTMPTIDWYKNHPEYKKIFHALDGSKSPQEIFEQTLRLLE